MSRAGECDIVDSNPNANMGIGMYIDIENASTLKDKLLLCAINEFAEYGYEGARVDNIVKSAGCSKQTVYHHFGNKENLFIAVLEFTWDHIRRREAALDLEGLSPTEAVERIIDFTWDYYLANPWFLKIVNSENQSKGEHLRKSSQIAKINDYHLNAMGRIVSEGVAQGVFRQGIDPVQLNISIAALGFFYLINQHTLAHVYSMDMTSRENLENRRSVIKETILHWIMAR